MEWQSHFQLSEEMIRECVSKDQWWDETFADKIKQNASRFPTRICVFDEKNRWTFLEIDQLSDRLAIYLL